MPERLRFRDAVNAFEIRFGEVYRYAGTSGQTPGRGRMGLRVACRGSEVIPELSRFAIGHALAALKGWGGVGVSSWGLNVSVDFEGSPVGNAST